MARGRTQDGKGAHGAQGLVVKLDRGYPLVRMPSGEHVRCEHATALVKGARVRAVIGDEVSVEIPEGHDKGVITGIAPRRTAFVRRDPAERTAAQVLAANFDSVIIAEPLAQINYNRLERSLVLAHQTGADVDVVLTKADLADGADQVEAVCRRVRDLAGSSVRVAVLSMHDAASVEGVRALIAPGSTAILIGKSGVGKSSLVNLLVGEDVMQTQSVRDRDGKGRHTTVSRELLDIPGAGSVVDMPGVRGLGLWEAEHGLDAAFPDIVALAEGCRFRDCQHGDEPGCAVTAAVSDGRLAQARLDSYRNLTDECEQMRRRQAEALHLRGEKASDRKVRKS